MNLSKEKINCFDYLILSVIGVFSLLYSVFYVNFAEVHIQLPFLNFPIFVGEFLLVFCFISLLIKWKIIKQKFSSGHYLLFTYVVFFLLKVVYGYIKWGPLALRHSALFYYPLFAVIGYYFYNPKMFRPVIKIFLAFIFLLMIWQNKFHDFFLFTYIALTLILILDLVKKWHKYILLGIFLVIIPYGKFFQPNRSFMVGLFSSFFFLYGCGVLFIPLRLRTRILLFVLFPTILFSWIFVQSFYLNPKSSAQRHSLKSLVDFGSLVREFKYYDYIISAEEENFKMVYIKPQLYKKTDPAYLIDTFEDSSVSKKEILEEQKIYKKTDPAYLIDTSEDSSVSKKEILEEQKIERETVGGPLPEGTILAFLPTESKKKLEIFGDFKEREVSIKEIKQIRKTGEKQEIIYDENFIELPADFSRDKLPLGTEFYRADEKGTIILPIWDAGYIKVKQVNTLFRLFLWRDMIGEIFEYKPLFGFDFGKPLRSKSLEILSWGGRAWRHNGWISPHNSYLHLLYRSGIVALPILVSLAVLFFLAFKKFFVSKSFSGIILLSTCVYWLVIANFLVLFELPYCSIPFWSLFGMIIKHSNLIYEGKDIKGAG